MKRILALALSFVLLFSLVACGGDDTDTTSSANNNPNVSSTMGKLPANPPQKPAKTEVGENGSRTDDPVGFQLELPEVGEKIVVLETSKGNIYIRLFPESAPITVTNFVGLVEAGYYNGITFHRVINDFMIQGGDPEGTGRGGESVWGGSFEDEFNANLLNIRGSLSMANSGVNTNGSQFYINQNPNPVSKSRYDYDTIYNQYFEKYGDEIKAEYENNKDKYPDYADAEEYMNALIDYNIVRNIGILGKDVSKEAWELYRKHGGNIHLDGAFKGGYGGHSVFAQVFSGMSVVDAIAAVKVDSSDRPLETVYILKAYTTTVTDDILALADPIPDDDDAIVVPN